MSAPIRYTSQKQQELISRHQLCERFTEFGWLSNSPEDLGEDFIVHIYFDGQATGVTYHVQEKSVTNLKEIRKGNYLIYDFKVKDLKHWEKFSLPVVLIVWDIGLREGRWALVDDVIADLSQRRPKWRENKSKARVYIPWNNTTDDAGLVKLKRSIGRHLYPLIARDQQLEMQMKLNFPDTEVGRAAQEAFERSIKEEEPITVTGNFIQELSFSEWWMRWFGEFDAKHVEISLGPSASQEILQVDINMISNNGEIVPTRTELKITKLGMEIAQLSNKHQDAALHFHVSIPRNKSREGSWTIKLNNMGRDVCQTRDMLRFLRAATAGGKLRVSFPTLNNISLTMPVPPEPGKAPDPQFLQLIDKLCRIQNKIGKFIQVPTEGLTIKDVHSVNKLVAIMECGKTITKAKEVIPGEFKENALDLILDVHRHSKPCHFTMSFAESHIELLELEIPRGV